KLGDSMDPFVGEIRAFGFNFAPTGWALCAGQTIAIQQNTALFSILGTSFGGNGTTNFMLPNLGANAPLHAGTGPGLSTYGSGDMAGSQSVTLDQSSMTIHTHNLVAQNGDPDVNTPSPVGNFLAKGGKPSLHGIDAYKTYTAVAGGVPKQVLAQGAVTNAGAGMPHENRQPNLALNFCIALQGVFPQKP
ncbi:MAG: phage tail protein, partial [bacterium]